MISIARANPSVGIVAAYTLLDYGTYSKVYLTGLPYPGTVTKGRDVCRRFLLGENIVFGSPTTNLIRADIVRSHDPFYDEKSVIADVEVCFEALKASDFGFVHQVLSCTRRYNESIVSVLSQCCYWNLTELITIRKYGSTFLQKDEYRQRYRQVEREYWKALGEGILRGQPKDFLEYHRSNLLTIGDELDALKLGWGVLLTLSDLVLNPKETVERLLRYKQKTRTNNFGKIDQYYNMNV